MVGGGDKEIFFNSSCPRILEELPIIKEKVIEAGTGKCNLYDTLSMLDD